MEECQVCIHIRLPTETIYGCLKRNDPIRGKTKIVPNNLIADGLSPCCSCRLIRRYRISFFQQKVSRRKALGTLDHAASWIGRIRRTRRILYGARNDRGETERHVRESTCAPTQIRSETWRRQCRCWRRFLMLSHPSSTLTIMLLPMLPLTTDGSWIFFLLRWMDTEVEQSRSFAYNCNFVYCIY